MPSQTRGLLSPSLWEEAAQVRTDANAQSANPKPSADGAPTATSLTVVEPSKRLPTDQIDADPRNPRAPTPAEVETLARSIRSHGLLQPIVVRPVRARYVVVAGHRRLAAWVACARATPSDPQWRMIDARVVHVGADQALMLLLIENLQRKSLSPLQEALTLHRLRLEQGWTNRQIAAGIHKSEMYVSRRLRVLEEEALRSALLENKLSVATAQEILTAPPSSRADLATRALAERWSPTEARRAVKALRAEVGGERERVWSAELDRLHTLLKIDSELPPGLVAEIGRTARQILERCDAQCRGS